MAALPPSPATICPHLPPVAAQLLPLVRPLFTLIELLVVIAIIGVLIGLLLPAVQASRESARWVQCNNNLRQLAPSINNYESSHEVLPPAGIVAPGRNLEPRSGKMFSWVVLILPQLELESIHARFDFERDVMSQPAEPQASHLPMMLCPGDSARGGYFLDPAPTNRKRFAKGNYAAWSGPFHIEMTHYPGALIKTGQPLQKITDGLSNTLILSDVRVRPHEQDQRGA